MRCDSLAPVFRMNKKVTNVPAFACDRGWYVLFYHNDSSDDAVILIECNIDDGIFLCFFIFDCGVFPNVLSLCLICSANGIFYIVHSWSSVIYGWKRKWFYNQYRVTESAGNAYKTKSQEKHLYSLEIEKSRIVFLVQKYISFWAQSPPFKYIIQ